MNITNVDKNDGKWCNSNWLCRVDFDRFELRNITIRVHRQDITIQQHCLAVNIVVLRCQVVLFPAEFRCLPQPRQVVDFCSVICKMMKFCYGRGGVRCLGGDEHLCRRVATEIDQK